MDKSEMKCSQAFLVICLHPRRSINVTLAIRLRKNRVWSVNLLQPVGNMAKRTKITNTATEAHFCSATLSSLYLSLMFFLPPHRDTKVAISTVAFCCLPLRTVGE